MTKNGVFLVVVRSFVQQHPADRDAQKFLRSAGLSPPNTLGETNENLKT